MGDRISFSLKLLQFEKVAVSHADMERSIRFYYSAPSLATRDPKFLGCSAQEIQQELHLRLDELEMNSVFSLFGALEASFRIDFLLRCYNREKDDLSRFFRAVKKEKEDKISLEEDIIEAWKTHSPGSKSLLSDLKDAFRHRHWLAHGRYWEPRLGRKYDFDSIYQLAQKLHQNLELLSLAAS